MCLFSSFFRLLNYIYFFQNQFFLRLFWPFSLTQLISLCLLLSKLVNIPTRLSPNGKCAWTLCVLMDRLYSRIMWETFSIFPSSSSFLFSSWSLSSGSQLYLVNEAPWWEIRGRKQSVVWVLSFLASSLCVDTGCLCPSIKGLRSFQNDSHHPAFADYFLLLSLQARGCDSPTASGLRSSTIPHLLQHSTLIN